MLKGLLNNNKYVLTAADRIIAEITEKEIINAFFFI